MQYKRQECTIAHTWNSALTDRDLIEVLRFKKDNNNVLCIAGQISSDIGTPTFKTLKTIKSLDNNIKQDAQYNKLLINTNTL